MQIEGDEYIQSLRSRTRRLCRLLSIGRVGSASYASHRQLPLSSNWSSGDRHNPRRDLNIREKRENTF